jgi:hypothetical protein
MKAIRGKLTYANVVSTICLFLLLGGGAAFAATHLPKNSVGTKQLKRGAVTPVKLSKSVKKQLARSARGTTGPQGPIGPQGLVGPQGAAGATNVVVRVGPTETGTSEVRCHAGEVAVGGGGHTESSQQLLYGSVPVTAAKEASEGERPIGWLAGGETPGGVAAPVTAYAICASP